jgi:hypothetical protein
MGTETPVNVREAIRFILHANSPNYIFSNLRRDGAVRAIAIRNSAADIVDWLRKNASGTPETIEDLAARYMHLVALSFREPKEFLPILDSLQLKDLEWGDDLRERIRSSAVAVSEKIVPPLPPQVTRMVRPRSVNKSQTIVFGE